MDCSRGTACSATQDSLMIKHADRVAFGVGSPKHRLRKDSIPYVQASMSQLAAAGNPELCLLILPCHLCDDCFLLKA